MPEKPLPPNPPPLAPLGSEGSSVEGDLLVVLFIGVVEGVVLVGRYLALW